MTIQELINKHIDQIRKDFKVPAKARIAKNSDLRPWSLAEIIELPKALSGMGRLYLSISNRLDGEPGDLYVELRIRITPRGKNPGPVHDLILETRVY